MPRCFISI